MRLNLTQSIRLRHRLLAAFIGLAGVVVAACSGWAQETPKLLPPPATEQAPATEQPAAGVPAASPGGEIVDGGEYVIDESAVLGAAPWQAYGRPDAATREARQILVQLPHPRRTEHGQLLVQPGVQVRAGGSEAVWHGGTAHPGPRTPERPAVFRLSSLQEVFSAPQPEMVPAPHVLAAESEAAGPLRRWIADPQPVFDTSAEPIFERILADTYFSQDRRRSRWHRLWHLFHEPMHCDVGVGRERLIYAPFEIDTSQPLASNIRLRFDSAYNWIYPDRAEFFQSKGRINTFAGQTPTPGRFDSVDYQDIRILMEFGGPKMTVGTEIPIRILDPTTQGANTAGMADMNVTTKTVLIDGDQIQITQLFRTYMNTGAPSHGLGTGHISLEPGLLFRTKWDEETYLHGEIKYWFPIAGDPEHSGQILRYGLGTSTIWYETDSTALLPTLEFVAWSVLDGAESNGWGTATNSVDGLAIVNMIPGLRLVLDRGGDLGLLELGVSGSFALTGPRWYESMLRFDCRWSF